MATATELKSQLDVKRGELSNFIKTHTNADNKLDFTPADITEFNQRNDELAPLVDSFTAAVKAEDAVKAMRQVDRSNLWAPQGVEERVQEIKSMGQLFIESNEYKANSESKPSTTGTWKAELSQASVSTTSAIKAALSTTTGTVPYAPARNNIVPFATRRPVMRDLVPMDDPHGQLIQFIRQNVQNFGAAVVAEGAAKPETSLGTERVVLQVEAIAHFIKVTDQALRFIPGIQNLIDTKGALGIQLAEESIMLNYNGAAGWKGFLTQTGVQTAARGTQDQFTAFHQGMNQVQFTGFANVTGGVINNNDWHKAITTKDANGRFIYGDPFATTQEARIWGVPLVVTPVMTEGTVLIGDFVMDSKWWVAGGVIVKVGYVNDDLTLNQQTIVVEEYGALEIDRPASFVKMTGWETL